MKLKFTKMHGAGNDFIVIDAMNQDVSRLGAEDWRALADRHFGIGADQILLVEKPKTAKVDFKYTIYNQDGSRVENCGNGARCFVKYVHEKSLSDKKEIAVQIDTGTMLLTLNDNGTVTVNMGVPKTSPMDLPAVVDSLPHKKIGDDTVYAINANGGTRWLSLVSMGNPHAVQIVEDVDRAPVAFDGESIGMLPTFPRQVNVGFMQIIDTHHIKLRVFERGAGETLACGTGACAAVVAGIRRGVLASPVSVQALGGELSIEWAAQNAPVMMSGPAVTVFEGEIELKLNQS